MCIPSDKNSEMRNKKTRRVVESPFSIPQNWVWCFLGECINLLSGADFETSKYNSSCAGIPYMTGASNIENGHLIINRWTEFPKCISHINDLLLICKGAGYGKTVFNNIGDLHIARQFMAISGEVGINLQYVKYYLDYFFNYNRPKGNGLIPGIDRNMVIFLPFPLPPIEEQQRIVDRLNELMIAINEYEKTEDQLTSIKKDFPGNLRSSIILAALQGKLTDQKEDDDSVDDLIQLLLAEKGEYRNKRKARAGVNIEGILEDELPFDIPSSWRFIRIIDMVKDIIAGGDKPKVFSKTKTEKCQIEVISNGEVNEGVFGYTDVATISERSLTVSGRGTIGYAVIRNEPYVPIVRLLVLIPLPHTNLEYLKYVLEGLLETGSGTAVKQLTVPMLSPKVIPLPPLVEQQRIVDTLNAILPACDKLSDEI